MCGYYSLANEATSTAIPDDIMVTTMTESESCGLRGCIKSYEHTHIYFSWDGNGHSHEKTWISADEKSTINLDDAI